MLVRNVGHHDHRRGAGPTAPRIPEGILDAVVTTADRAARPARRRARATAAPARSTSSSRRCTGPDEVAFANELFDRVEDLLGLPRNTIKIGIMDEERRTSVNLKACIRAARDRVVFINTGFLDRTGDEIHTSMEAGPDGAQGRHEDAALDQGLRATTTSMSACLRLLRGKAQIGKGMWAMPDRWPTCWRRRSATRGRRQHRLGALAHRRHAARAALPPGRCARRARRS
jgi:malate synthase